MLIFDSFKVSFFDHIRDCKKMTSVWIWTSRGTPNPPHPKVSQKLVFPEKLGGYPPQTLSLNFTNKNMKFNPEIAFFFLGGSAPQTPLFFGF